MIRPHGGVLINRIVDSQKKKEILDKLNYSVKILLNKRHISDIEMIAQGAFSPLKGFMCKKDYESVLKDMRLSPGIVWSLPITLDVNKEVANNIKEGEFVFLKDEDDFLVAALKVEEKFEYDKKKEAILVYRTDDEKHPGVARLYSQGEVYLGGEIFVLQLPEHKDFVKYRFTSKQTREIFKTKNWRTVVGFQTRNPIHRAHEYIIKCALEVVDGVFIHPIVGETKQDDIPAEVRIKCYEVLIENYFPKDRVVLCVNPAYMRYAGPREAIFHAIVRKNYGCTHFIVGRDHAGVGNYYGPYDAQKIFYEFKPEELEITPLFFENTFYCMKCNGMASYKTCPHTDNDRIILSGTKVRKMLQDEEVPPVEFTRPEIANILIDYTKNKLT
ncbi:MAG: sulfate adenylyltransferase [Endomicrobia bacterium]|nr:sulfate adenylyltransferase [Endomicrobiia bacterium]